MNRSKYLSQLKAKNIEVHINVLTDEEVKKLLSPKNGWEERRSSGATLNIFEKIDFHVSKPLKKSAIADAGSSQANVADAGSSQVNIADVGSSPVNNADAASSQVNITDSGSQVNNVDAGSSRVNNADSGSSQVNNADAGSSEVNNADAGSSEVNNADSGSSQVSITDSGSQVNNVDAGSSQVNNADAGSSQVNNADAGSSQVNNADAGSSQVNNADAGSSEVNNADSGSSQVNSADAGSSPQTNNADAGCSQVNIANAGPSQVNIAERCTPLMKKAYKSNTPSQLINLASTLPSMHTSSVSSAVNEDVSDSKLTNTFFKDFTIQTSAMSILPCKRLPSSSIGDQKDDRKSHKIQLPAGGVPKKRKADCISSLGSDSSVTHIGSNENALTNIQSNCTTNTKLCGAENFTTDLEVKWRVGELQAYQISCSSSNSSQANFSEDELDRMMINESDIPSAESLTSISFNTMSENEPKEGTKIPEQGNDVFLDQESIITSKETSQEETAAAEQKTNFHLKLDHYIKHFSRLPNMDYTDIISNARDIRSTEVQEVGNQNKEETESSSSTLELPEILNEKQEQETGETESLIEVPRESTDDKMNTYTLATHFSDTSNRNLENAAPFPFYEEKAVFTERSAKTTCGSKQHNLDSASSLDHHLYTTERNWECQNNKNKEDVELSVTPNQNIEHNSINAHASYSRQFSEEHESGTPLFVNHYSKEQFDHENISWPIENVPNHNILEEQVESGKTNVWTCSVDESPHKNMEMDISCSDDVQKYLEDMPLNQPSEELSTTCPCSQNSYDAKDEIHDETIISTFTSVHSDAFVNNEVLNEGTSIEQVTLNLGDKIDPYEKLVKDSMNGMDSYLDNGNWFGVCVKETLQIETTSMEEHCTSFSENHNQAAFPENHNPAAFPENHNQAAFLENHHQAAFPENHQTAFPENQHQAAFPENQHQAAFPENHQTAFPENQHQAAFPENHHQAAFPENHHQAAFPENHHQAAFSENHHQAAFPYGIMQEQTGNEPTDVFSSLLAVLKHQDCGGINLSQNHYNQMPLVEECVEISSQEKNISTNIKCEQAVPKVVVLDRSSDMFFYTLKDNACEKEFNCHVNDQEQLKDASNVNFDITLPWLFSPHENPNII